MSKVVVIGAGIAGLAVAIRLALKGHNVRVFDSAEKAGGKLTEIHSAGYRFDAGPSLFTMPQYVDELFELAGKNPRDYFNYKMLDTICRYFYEDGTRLNAFADTSKFAHEVEINTLDSSASVLKFLKKSAEIYEITNPVFLQKSLHKLKSYLNLATLKSALRFPSIDPFRTMNQANKATFKDLKTVQLFNRYATYNGSDPYQAPATLNIIPHFEQHFGAWFPEGGMYTITSSLKNLADELGVQFDFNTYVDEIIVKDHKVSGVRIGNQEFAADLIVSNMDVWYTYERLLSSEPVPKQLIKQERSSSALIFYWGISTQFPELDLHNIFFSANYEQEFKQIWQEQHISDDPTIYINISSKMNEPDAPAQCENWFTMINVPANKGQDWDVLIKEARKNILAKLSRLLQRDIEPLIVTEEILDPRSIDSKTFSFQGSLYGSSSNDKFSAFLRHPNFSSHIHNLYFVGGSVHPGGGIPLALLSAKIVDDLL